MAKLYQDWWVPLVSATKLNREDTDSYLEQRLRGVRKKGSHASSPLNLEGLWAAQVISSSQAVASAQLMLRCQSRAPPCFPTGLCHLLQVGTWGRSALEAVPGEM